MLKSVEVVYALSVLFACHFKFFALGWRISFASLKRGSDPFKTIKIICRSSTYFVRFGRWDLCNWKKLGNRLTSLEGVVLEGKQILLPLSYFLLERGYCILFYLHGTSFLIYSLFASYWCVMLGIIDL